MIKNKLKLLTQGAMIISALNGCNKNDEKVSVEPIIEIQRRVFDCALERSSMFGQYEKTTALRSGVSYDPRTIVRAQANVNGNLYKLGVIDYKTDREGVKQIDRDSLLIIKNDSDFFEDNGLNGKLGYSAGKESQRGYQSALVDLDNLCSGKISKDPIFSVNSNTTTRELYQILEDSLIFKPYPINDNGIIETEGAKTTILLMDDRHGSPEIELKQIKTLSEIYGDSLIVALEGYAEDSSLVNAESRLVRALVKEDKLNTLALEDREIQILALKWVYLYLTAEHNEALRLKKLPHEQYIAYSEAKMQRKELEKELGHEINDDAIIKELKESVFNIDVNVNDFEWGNADKLILDKRNEIAVDKIVKRINKLRSELGPNTPINIVMVMGQAHSSGVKKLIAERIQGGLNSNFIHLGRPFK